MIRHDVYAKTPVALEAVLAKLRAIGYQVNSLRDPEYQQTLGGLSTSVTTRENGRYVLWSAQLEVRRGKCTSCQRYIKTDGIESHGHQCEHCNAVTYEEIVDGATVRFSFIPRHEDDALMGPTMKAKRWDTETGTLYLYPETLDDPWMGAAVTQSYLQRHADKWQMVQEDGQQLIRVRHSKSYDRASSDVEVTDVQGSRRNYRIVQVWEGKEYGEFDKTPFPTSLSIYEAWRWAPLPSSPQLHKTVLAAVGCTADKGYYHQDGRPYFDAKKFQDMGVFARHFTTLDADEWDRCSRHFRLDAPSGIDDIARFCHSNPDIEDRPNLGNFIAGLSKVMRGEPLRDRELTTFADAVRDPQESQKVQELLKALSKR